MGLQSVLALKKTLKHFHFCFLAKKPKKFTGRENTFPRKGHKPSHMGLHVSRAGHRPRPLCKGHNREAPYANELESQNAEQ